MPPPPSAWEIGFIAMRDDLCSQTRVLHPLYKGLPKGFSSQSAWVKGGWRLDTKKPALVAGHLKESTQTGIRTQDSFPAVSLGLEKSLKPCFIRKKTTVNLMNVN